jgi:hypothetical protein
VAVGRDEAHPIGAQDEEGAVQEIPRVFAGDRELRLRDHLFHHVARQGGGERARGVRQRREVFPRQRLHPRVEPIGRHLHAVLVLLDPDVGLGQRLDDLVELLRRQRQGAALADRRRTAAAQPDLEIGRQKLHLVAVGLDEHVREDGNRVLAFDDPLEQLQFSQQIGLADDQFHTGVDLARMRAGGARYPSS